MKKDRTHDEESFIIDIKFHIVFFILAAVSIMVDRNYGWQFMNYFMNEYFIIAFIIFIIYVAAWFWTLMYGLLCGRPIIFFGSVVLFIYCQF
jgi:hypothetical protein